MKTGKKKRSGVNANPMKKVIIRNDEKYIWVNTINKKITERSDIIKFIKEYQPDRFLIIQTAIEEILEGKMIVRDYK